VMHGHLLGRIGRQSGQNRLSSGKTGEERNDRPRVERICVLAVAAVALVLSSSGSIIAAAVAAPGWMCVRGFSLMG
jgi:hypothetical protein